jgi:hypothetical protein
MCLKLTLFSSKTVASGVNYRDEKITKKPLPPLTFCPWPAFKKRGFHFNRKKLDENTFGLDDIFQPDTVTVLKNKTRYEIKEIRNYYIGKCFTMRSLISFRKIEEGVLLKFKKTFDITLFIHSIDDEFWINFGWYPTLYSEMFLAVKSLEDARFASLHLTEKEVTKISQENFRCKEYEKTDNPHSQFVDCHKRQYINYYPWSELQCLLPGFDDALPNINLRECTNFTEAANSSKMYGDLKFKAKTQVLICLQMLAILI